MSELLTIATKRTFTVKGVELTEAEAETLLETLQAAFPAINSPQQQTGCPVCKRQSAISWSDVLREAAKHERKDKPKPYLPPGAVFMGAGS